MRKLTMLMLAASTMVLSGCWGERELNLQTSEGETAVQAEKKKQYAAPLTGESSGSQLQRRTTAVVINNHPSARPQTGLSQADIVYEVLAEGNVTRFLALYQSEQPDTAGPVRSARAYFIELAKGYESLFIAHGYSPQAKEMLVSGEIDHLNGMQYAGKLFTRDPSRVSPHNSYVSFKEIEKKAQEKAYNYSRPPGSLSFLTSADMDSLNGDTAENVQINYSNNEDFQTVYEFNEAAGNYQRSAGGERTTERETGQPIEIDNIFIIEADHRVLDAEGRLTIDLTSGGSAYLIQKGVIQSVEWSNVNGRILPYKNGVPQGFLPGKTWINIIPASKGLHKMIDIENK